MANLWKLTTIEKIQHMLLNANVSYRFLSIKLISWNDGWLENEDIAGGETGTIEQNVSTSVGSGVEVHAVHTAP